MKAQRIFAMILTKLKTRIPFLLTGFLLFAALTIGLHNHSDNAPHDDCSICVASHHFPAISSSAGNISVHTVTAFLELPEKTFYLPLRAKIIYGIRAPPFSSQTNHTL